jgi:hypothetical protein
MSILDDAIREHLELKRQHGADESELKRLEDEAFGPPGRPEGPDPFAEAPTEFMSSPEAPAVAEPAPEDGGRRINIADLQEPPQAAAPAPAVEEAPLSEEEPPPEEEPTAMEHEIVAEPVAADEPEAAEPEPELESDPERQALAEQPTELFDVEADIAEAPSPSDEEIAEAEAAEPKLAPVEPATEIHATRAEPAEPAEEAEEEYEEDDDFWSEQRLSDELDQALEAPPTEEHEVAPAGSEDDHEDEEDDAPQPRPDYHPDTGHEDVLEDTPEFLEDAPEDDELWFEQRPPKDFDFDD